MVDLLIRGLDDEIIERANRIAEERRWTVDEVLRHAVRFALGFTSDDLLGHGRAGDLRGVWNTGESAAFIDAVRALEKVDDAPLFPDAPEAGDEPREG